MGGSQSARKVTLDNPNPDPHDLNNAIRVSYNVVERLKSPQYLSSAADAAGQSSEDKPQPMIGTPVSKPHFYSLRDEMKVHGLPYLTTKDIQEYVQSEVDQTNKYWEERMKKLQEGHKRMEQKMLDEYTKAQIELEKHLPRQIPEDAEVPCTDLSGNLAKCFKDNQKESLKCLPQIEAFKGCLSEARKHVVQEEDDYLDECKYQDYREKAEKQLEEHKQKEAKKKEERDKIKEKNKAKIGACERVTTGTLSYLAHKTSAAGLSVPTRTTTVLQVAAPNPENQWSSDMSALSSSSNTLSSLGFRFCVDTVTHPLEYAKFLIQVGHEPLPPFPTKTIFGRPVMGLPNCFKYVQYIHSVDGWSGCYRGVAPKLIGRAVGSCAATAAIGYWGADQKNDLEEDMELTDSEKLSMLKTSLMKDVIGRTCMVFVSHPFLVVSNRMMAEFVGKENKYSGIFSSIAEIFREGGISGFFSGVIPRWIGELIYVGLSSLAIYSLNNYLIADNELRAFTSFSVQCVTSSVVYPFFLVSSCMSVNNCSLVAGRPPNMPIYTSWRGCWKELSLSQQLNRGSSPIFRYYTAAPPNGLKTLASG